MRKYKLLLIIILIIGISVAYFFWSKKTELLSPIETAKESIKVIEKSTQVKDPIDQMSIQDKLKQNKTNIAPLKKLLAKRIPAFHPNPAVDALLIKANLSHCIEILNSDIDQIESGKSTDNTNAAQKKLKKELDIYCENLNQNHPEYMLIKENDINILRDSIDKDGEIGKIFSMHYNKISDSEIIESKIKLLKNTNPNLLFDQWRYFSSYIYRTLDDGISEIIKSNDGNYVSIVRSHAFDYYACEAGANCGVHSNLMAKMCLNDNLCGNDFNEILNTKMPEGIRADIILVFNYLKEILD